MKRILTITALGAAVLAAGCGSTGHPAAASGPVTRPANCAVYQPGCPVTYSAQPSVSAVPATTVLPAGPTAAPPPPPPPQFTASQQQAVDAADNYLSDGQGFSKAGLTAQLDSAYGNGFSYADAVFAVNHVQVSWYQQAAISARNYMNDGQGFSCSSLLSQLTSAYGGQFTQSQAEYGVHSVGLGYC